MKSDLRMLESWSTDLKWRVVSIDGKEISGIDVKSPISS